MTSHVQLADNQRIKLLLISSVQPDEKSLGGSLILKRYLESGDYDWQQFRPSRAATFKKRIVDRVKRSRFGDAGHFLECIAPPTHSRAEMAEHVESFKPDILLTVAHGWSYVSAHLASVQFRLPLVMLLQDWWPDKSEVHPLSRTIVTRRLKAIGRQCSKVVCVSSGIRRELGSLPNSTVLHDLPSVIPRADTKDKPSHPYRVIYFGNLYEYGPMVESLALECVKSESVHLDIFGPEPWWGNGIADMLRARGMYHGLVSPAECISRAQECHAGLATMSFDPKLKRRMQTSFPSKLIELSQLRLPLIVWGPEYCAAVEWARSSNAALCVTENSPEAVRRAMEELASSPSEHERLARASERVSQQEFNPHQIRNEFKRMLGEVIGQSRQPHP